MSTKYKVGIVIAGLILFVFVLSYMKKEKERKAKEEQERLARIAAGGQAEPCQVISFDQFEIEKDDWFWWLRRSAENMKNEAYNEFKKPEDGKRKHPSYFRWADNKMKELNLCREDV